ncbi:MAG: SpoIVB peptidase [Lachnospiraceae bacterium]|nr:SpoIVB peptidase [Lachnospiraceae bacterium]
MVVFLEEWKKRKKRLRVYRICLCGALFCCSLGAGVWGYFDLYNQLPAVLRVKAGEEQVLDFGLPLTGEVVSVSEGGKSNIPQDAITIDLSQEVTLQMEESSNYQMNVKLFGCLPFKQVGIQVIGETELTPAGIPIGLYVETDGLLVIGVGDFQGTDGISYCPAKYILKSGDYILECNGEAVTDKDTFIEDIERCGGENVLLKIQRDGEEQEISIKPEKNSAGKYKIGIWVRDNAQGVGTLTYIDSEGKFGALGHGVTDVDTSTLMTVEDGTLYQTEIIAIKKGKVGTPGEMTGMIVYEEDRILGDIDYNGTEGIFGSCNEDALKLCTTESLPIGLKQDIKKGPAQIYCTLNGETKYYEIEITGVQLDNDNVNRGIEILVTDVELLELTGGIVQGMSGSPIIQDGKFIGAVTHVLVNDPTRGYGIFIENMLEH